jgi:hypothetical protein
MRKIILIAIALMLVVDDAKGQSGGVFKCTTKSVRQLDSNGSMVENKVTKYSMRLAKKFTFDEASGILLKGPIQMTLRIIQRRGGGRDIVGIIGDSIVAPRIFSLFRVRQWEKNMPFLYLERLMVYSGNCTYGKN